METIVIYFVPVGRPEEQDDSENSTIYITGLTEKANIEEMAEFFKHVGPIRVIIAFSPGLPPSSSLDHYSLLCLYKSSRSLALYTFRS